MADASLRKIARDATLAAAFLAQAHRFLADGANPDNSHASRQVLLHNAVIAACDAVLAIEGYEVEGSEGGHRLRLEQAQRRLGSGLDDLFDQLDVVRLTRASVSCAAGFVPESDVDEAVMAVTQVVRHAEDHVASRGVP
jgi:hypothetical protein